MEAPVLIPIPIPEPAPVLGAPEISGDRNTTGVRAGVRPDAAVGTGVDATDGPDPMLCFALLCFNVKMKNTWVILCCYFWVHRVYNVGKGNRREERRGREGRTVECTCAGYVGHAFFLDAVAAVLFSSRRMRPLHTAPIHATLASDILIMFCRSSD